VPGAQQVLGNGGHSFMDLEAREKLLLRIWHFRRNRMGKKSFILMVTPIHPGHPCGTAQWKQWIGLF
jgi:predicted neutral ceramidase superfamily lipid hydrolase